MSYWFDRENFHAHFLPFYTHRLISKHLSDKEKQFFLIATRDSYGGIVLDL